MSGFNSYAIWGAGNLGKLFISELLSYKTTNPNLRVTVLTRPESVTSESNKALATSGAEIRAWDPTSSSASDALQDIEVFICTPGVMAGPLQVPAVYAAGKAGVKLFVPNDFGNDIYAADTPWHKAQQATHEAAKVANIPLCSFSCGTWPDVLFRFGFDLEKGKIDIAGDGTRPLSLTSIHDTARFAAYALVHLPQAQLLGRTFRIQGDFPTPLDLANELNEISPKPLDIIHTSVKDIQVKRAEGLATGDIQTVVVSSFRLGFAAGVSKLDQDKLDNDIWPEWNPKRAVDVLKRELLGEGRYM